MPLKYFYIQDILATEFNRGKLKYKYLTNDYFEAVKKKSCVLRKAEQAYGRLYPLLQYY